MTLYFEPKIKTHSRPEVSYITSECEKYSGKAHLHASNLEILGWFYRNSRIQSHGGCMRVCSRGVYTLGTKDFRETIPCISLCEMLFFFQFSDTGMHFPYKASLSLFFLFSIHTTNLYFFCFETIIIAVRRAFCKRTCFILPGR